MHRARILALGAAAFFVLAPAGEALAKPKPKAPRDITVMTRNIYLGGDIGRPLRATAGKDGLDALAAFGNANRELRAIVDKTDFPARSKLLAKEILQRKPDLVGLQEVALWRRGPFDLGAVLAGKPGATQVDYDFLKTLLKDLKGKYVAVTVQQQSDVEGPAFEGPDPFADPNAFNARLTMRDVILRRKAAKLKILRKGGGQYKTRIDVKLSEATFSFVRGYNWADVRLGKKTLRFVNTHLESETSTVALAQAKELFAGPVKKAGSKPVIVVCDCNSDPKLSASKPNDIPHYSAYRWLTGKKVLNDQWLRLKPASPGFTSGYSELVNDPDTKAIDHRIDLVLARRANGKPMKSVRGWITGTDPKNRSASGLWPSDHAGVVVKLRP